MKKILAAGALALGMLGAPAIAQDAPFGTDADADYAALVWDVMVSSGFAGDGAVMTVPYDGAPPHGMMLETYYTKATIKGHTGDLVIKRNYGPEGVDGSMIMADPSKHLGAVTVMFRREAGYDDDNANWFWIKFLPDGSLDKNPKGMRLAGRVAKGADAGCIACHSNEDDYLFTTDHITQ
ncbi:MAG: cytochrome P460 family protein [Marinosulfonomonas sp.]|nr:cytochrome P460 family protein [Marinosulfonomonas sp.]